MSTPVATQRMTAAEYLVWEREQTERHEFHRGEVFAMAGGSRRHNYLAGAMQAELRVATREKGCSTFPSDQRVMLAGGERYVYPDITVECGAARRDEGPYDVVTNPSVIVEVLSKSTEGYDRGEKWEEYQRIPSLTDYVLVSQKAAHVEHFRRGDDGAWSYRAYGAGDSLVLANGASISIDAVYQGAFQHQGDAA